MICIFCHEVEYSWRKTPISFLTAVISYSSINSVQQAKAGKHSAGEKTVYLGACSMVLLLHHFLFDRMVGVICYLMCK